VEQPPEDEQPWVPPVWPRYVGIGWLAFCVVGFAALGLLAIPEVSGEDGVNGEAVMGVVLAVAGTIYVVPQLRTAWARLREAKER
jgi:hypothetical protein